VPQMCIGASGHRQRVDLLTESCHSERLGMRDVEVDAHDMAVAHGPEHGAPERLRGRIRQMPTVAAIDNHDKRSAIDHVLDLDVEARPVTQPGPPYIPQAIQPEKGHWRHPGEPYRALKRAVKQVPKQLAPPNARLIVVDEGHEVDVGAGVYRPDQLDSLSRQRTKPTSSGSALGCLARSQAVFLVVGQAPSTVSRVAGHGKT